ncbi:hypothetical protein NRB20_36930 [Nocardia sp. RB20]|uniref:Uncharacterized protein n=1 Tax=Nocardia macrotermitis TaxID=2585198 RepID=A0A7K0D4C5_9NOCA|nr:hypothetical protein [Nocardia macrotermitis]
MLFVTPRQGLSGAAAAPAGTPAPAGAPTATRATAAAGTPATTPARRTATGIGIAPATTASAVVAGVGTPIVPAAPPTSLPRGAHGFTDRATNHNDDNRCHDDEYQRNPRSTRADDPSRTRSVICSAAYPQQRETSRTRPYRRPPRLTPAQDVCPRSSQVSLTRAATNRAMAGANRWKWYCRWASGVTGTTSRPSWTARTICSATFCGP